MEIVKNSQENYCEYYLSIIKIHVQNGISRKNISN
jgi:hypothetical protein